jgi:peptidoglycan hydrolase-like protein with peptidoglycan-binding domain
MGLTRVWMPSPNYSSRGGATVRLIVLHTAEGATTIESLGNFFKNPSSGVSSHVGIDDKLGKIGEYVTRGNKAWTQGNANPVSVAAELCAFASWSNSTWMNSHANMLNNCARWIAEESGKFGIPITKLTASQAQGSGRGVCQHRDLGTWGGNHSDCGNGFPMDHVLNMARDMLAGGSGGGGGGTTPPPTTGKAPPLHVDYFGQSHNRTCGDVQVWQAQMSGRGWTISVDGEFGPQSENVCRQFQSEKGLSVDGMVGPNTWEATWSAPIT